MRRGDFDSAWKFSDQVLNSGINRDYEHVPRHFQNIWDGTPLNDKRVLIRCYHGLGDTIQFIRYMPMLKEIAAQVIVWAQQELLDVLKTTGGIDQLLPLHNGIPEADFDVDVEIMELQHVFWTSLYTIPSGVPYLHVSPLQLFPENEDFTIGLVWQAGEWDQSRNVPFYLLKPLFGMERVNFLILQANALEAGWEKGWGTYPGKFNMYDYARVIKGLDLLITVDSMPAHLAGALNVPVWVMLQTEADWRWMELRNDSPWYPSMKLFRQKVQGDWGGVINKIMSGLKDIKKVQ